MMQVDASVRKKIRAHVGYVHKSLKDTILTDNQSVQNHFVVPMYVGMPSYNIS